MGPSYFGKVAANNSEVVARLLDGDDVRTQTARAARSFISSNDAAKPEKPAKVEE